MSLAANTQANSRATGTKKNRYSTLKEYFLFNKRFGKNPLSPTSEFICAFIEHIMLRKVSPLTMKNKISHVRSYLKIAGGDMSGINSYWVEMSINTHMKSTSYKPRAKQVVPLNIVKSVIANMTKDHMGWVLRASFLMILYGAFRQGDILPASKKSFNEKKHLTKGDVSCDDNSIRVVQKWAKNMSGYSQRRSLTFQVCSNPEMCVVTAVKNVMFLTPTRSKCDPMFVFPDTMEPFTLTYLRKVWTSELSKLKCDPSKFSIHSIRKLVATLAYQSGASELDIRSYGGWVSHAVRVYIDAHSDQKINSIIREHLA